MLLAGDIGGTKTILALFEANHGALKIHGRQVYSSNEFQTFDQLLLLFLADDFPQLDAVCIGVAGPVNDGICNTTILPWTLQEEAIKRLLGTDKVCLLNDLEAAAWGVLDLPQSELTELNPQAIQRSRQEHVAIIAAGTGLGEAILCRGENTSYVMATEGGHTDFAANVPLEDELLAFLRTKYPEHVSYERVVSGEGLFNIYQFLKQAGYGTESAHIKLQISERDPAAVIGEAGVAGEDTLCTQALQLFCGIYGAEAGNLALKCLPYGGIYLAGGIAVKILPCLLQGHFMRGFLRKGRFRNLLQQMPVRVCLNPELGLLGAAAYAAKLNNDF